MSRSKSGLLAPSLWILLGFAAPAAPARAAGADSLSLDRLSGPVSSRFT